MYDIEHDVHYGLEINATYNWWGTTNESKIDERIFDYYDDYNLGKVFYEPFELEVIPEFSPFIILTIFLIVTTIVLVFRKRLYHRIP